MFRRILVANRGEIALRVVRAAHDLGVEVVVVHSEADRGATWLDAADDAICIGPAPAAQSYLDVPRIIAAAEVTDAEAVHPGYGFLAENPHFAEVCESCRLTFIGPPSEVIAACGDKAQAKEVAKRAGVPVVPGSDGPIADAEEALRVAAEIGYPVILKASAGGGGRGMRVAHTELALRSAFDQARAEAQAAFKNPEVYLEKFLEDPRHVEFQVLAGNDGKVIHLGERDCSVQRRHQKLIEESPSPALDEDLRRRMGEAAVAFAREAGYRNAGTVEFLLDREGNFYFIELNARIQVEHCVTEMVTGEDLVAWQLRIAAGEELTLSQDDVALCGHAIEFRINAEDPARGFAPTAGRVERVVWPGGPYVRVDTHLAAGSRIPPEYDSLVAKLVVHGHDREHALHVARRALREVRVEGPGLATTAPFHLRVLDRPEFREGRFDTGFLERMLATP